MEHTVVASTETHDFSKRLWGNDASITHIINAGERLRLAVWSQRPMKVGDYLILRNGRGTTRYRVDDIEHQLDPADMKFVDASFAPRSPGD